MEWKIQFWESYWKCGKKEEEANKVNCLFGKEKRPGKKIFTFFLFSSVFRCEIYEIFSAIILREELLCKYRSFERKWVSEWVSLCESIMKSKWEWKTDGLNVVTPFVCLRPLVIHSSCPTWPSILLPWETICLERTIWRGRENSFSFFLFGRRTSYTLDWPRTSSFKGWWYHLFSKRERRRKRTRKR